MKKSDAIKIISDYIDIQEITGRHLTARNLLDLIETAIGMKPPYRPSDEKVIRCQVSEWEPE